MKADRAKNSAGSDEETASPVISTKHEEKKVQDRVAINAHVVYESIRREGEEELDVPPFAVPIAT